MKKVITFESIPPARVMARYVLGVFGLTTNEDGIIVDQKRRKAIGLDGKPVSIHEFAGIIKTKKGPRLVRDGIVDLLQVADHVSDKCDKKSGCRYK